MHTKFVKIAEKKDWKSLIKWLKWKIKGEPVKYIRNPWTHSRTKDFSSCNWERVSQVRVTEWPILYFVAREKSLAKEKREKERDCNENAEPDKREPCSEFRAHDRALYRLACIDRARLIWSVFSIFCSVTRSYRHQLRSDETRSWGWACPRSSEKALHDLRLSRTDLKQTSSTFLLRPLAALFFPLFSSLSFSPLFYYIFSHCPLFSMANYSSRLIIHLVQVETPLQWKLQRPSSRRQA